MADQIKVSTDEMNLCIAQYTAQKAKLMSALSICVSATNLLYQSWAGPSFAVCWTKMQNTWKNLNQTEDKIEDAITELRKTISNMQAAEGKIQANVGSLDTGTSPFA